MTIEGIWLMGSLLEVFFASRQDTWSSKSIGENRVQGQHHVDFEDSQNLKIFLS